jgi:hypothetical protein
MARNCACSKILDLLHLPQVRALPLATRAVLVEVMHYLAQSTTPGAIRFLSPVMGSVSAWLSISETEAETHLESLVRLGFVALDEDGLGLHSPSMKAAADRANVNRINGLKGGRPRKYAVPGQREMLHAIPGGKTEITETEKPPVSAPSSSLEIASKEEAVAREGWVDLGQEIAAGIGLDPAKGFVNCRPAQEWLAMGLSPAQIRAVAAEVAGRGKTITGLAYFTPAMREAAAASKPEPVEVVAPHVTAYLAAMQAWQRDRVGPPPVMQQVAA